jgi:hypothetical protein
VWHDDVRPAPEGWVWARTNGRAKDLLYGDDVIEISMDHDLGLHDIEVPDPGEDPDGFADAIAGRGQASETGLDLVNWMVEQGLVPPLVTIHSWNPDGAQAMAARLNFHGYDCTVQPFRPTRVPGGPI